jgi:hypothetical protein
MFTLDGVRKFHGWTHASLALLLDHLSAIPPAVKASGSKRYRGSRTSTATLPNVPRSSLRDSSSREPAGRPAPICRD